MHVDVHRRRRDYALSLSTPLSILSLHFTSLVSGLRPNRMLIIFDVLPAHLPPLGVHFETDLWNENPTLSFDLFVLLFRINSSHYDGIFVWLLLLLCVDSPHIRTQHFSEHSGHHEYARSPTFAKPIVNQWLLCALWFAVGCRWLFLYTADTNVGRETNLHEMPIKSRTVNLKADATLDS